MKFSSRKEGDVVVYDIQGSVEGGPESYAIKDDVKARLEAGERKFLLNMDKMTWVNSTGIGIITSVYTSIRGAAGTMKICNANERVSRIMVITKLLEVFDSYYQEEEALAAFRSA